MTTPRLTECPHSETGWCLDCVNKLNDDNTNLLEACMATLHALENGPQLNDIIWILPPFCAEGIHETVFDRLDEAIQVSTGIEYNRCHGGNLTDGLQKYINSFQGE